MARLILDTGVLIAGVRRRLDPVTLAPDDDVAIPAIVVAEYLAGVEADDNTGRAASQRAFLDDVLAATAVIDYDTDIARAHATLLAHVRAGGQPRGPHDLIIAATAHATDRTLLTTDVAAGFDELPGVRVRLAAR